MRLEVEDFIVFGVQRLDAETGGCSVRLQLCSSGRGNDTGLVCRSAEGPVQSLQPSSAAIPVAIWTQRRLQAVLE